MSEFQFDPREVIEFHMPNKIKTDDGEITEQCDGTTTFVRGHPSAVLEFLSGMARGGDHAKTLNQIAKDLGIEIGESDA